MDVIQPVAGIPVVESLSTGRRFINKLMALVRKEGHREFAVYEYKLRDRTPGTDIQFARAIQFLEQRGCLAKRGSMVMMAQEGAEHMFQPKLSGAVGYEGQARYWDPLVRGLDEILAI